MRLFGHNLLLLDPVLAVPNHVQDICKSIRAPYRHKNRLCHTDIDEMSCTSDKTHRSSIIEPARTLGIAVSRSEDCLSRTALGADLRDIASARNLGRAESLTYQEVVHPPGVDNQAFSLLWIIHQSKEIFFIVLACNRAQ